MHKTIIIANDFVRKSSRGTMWAIITYRNSDNGAEGKI
jgi:hypothetical protein